MTSITDTMQHDHVLIDGYAERAAAAAETSAWPDLEREGGEFLRRLRRHIEMEEGVLFPAFEERTGMVQAGPSAQMRMEHTQMQPILEQMQAAISAHDGASYRRASQALFEILLPHNQKEEQMMYPMLDQAVGDQASALLAQVRAMAI